VKRARLLPGGCEIRVVGGMDVRGSDSALAGSI